MSRVFKYITYTPVTEQPERSYFRSWFCFLSALGYSFKKDTHAIRVNGCGMDMNFATCYDVAHTLMRIGILSKEECQKLEQQTPSIQ